MSAALAAQTEIRTAALYEHFIASTAGVFFFHHEYIADFNIHMLSRSFLHTFLLYHYSDIFATTIVIFLAKLEKVYPQFLISAFKSEILYIVRNI